MKECAGVIAEIIDVKEELQTAIEIALGASMQNIVTKTEEDAKKLIEYLRVNNLGRASFLPISSVKGKKLEKFKTLKKGIIGIALDLVKYDKKYEQIMQSLLGRTVIVDDMNTAIMLAKENNYSFRIVTKEGDIINQAGAITGGSISKKTVNILGKRNRKTWKRNRRFKSKNRKNRKRRRRIYKSSRRHTRNCRKYRKQITRNRNRICN